MVKDLPIIHLRRIEANIVKPIYEELVEELGAERAREVLGRAIRRNAIAQGQAMAEAIDGPADIAGFAALLPLWQKEDALEIEVLGQSEAHFDFNVRRCRYAEMYREMGLAEIGDLLSCGRDGAMCEGFNPDLKMDRSQTIIDSGVNALKILMPRLDARLAQGAYLGGDDICFADILAGHVLFRYDTVDFPKAETPNLDAYYARLTERPAYREHVMVSYESLRAV